LHYGKKLFGTARLDLRIGYGKYTPFSDMPNYNDENGFAFYADNTIHNYDADDFSNESDHYE
jgi:hypothetical protein